ncbi:MAG TPA: tryptophan synthase subunit alpha [Candidatus Binatia bacterium]
MDRIAATFGRLRAAKQAGFVPFIMAGDPDLDATLELMRAAAAAGADVIELGVPFSDPMADGPVVQRSAERALAAGTALPGILEIVARFRAGSDVPVILFGYANPFEQYGAERLARDARASGADGLLCVDMPPEEADDLQPALDAEGLAMIFLLAPTSDAARRRRVLARARGFLYYVSITGVTGGAAPDIDEVATMVRTVQGETPLPVGVGFGIRTPQQAAATARIADAVVVGSAVVSLVEAGRGPGLVAAVSELFTVMTQAVHDARRYGGA